MLHWSRTSRFSHFFLALIVLLVPVASARDFDVVVVGGTPGGISTAVTAARLGHRVALVEYYAHLGGMTTSGLGKSDITVADAIGGLWDEFVARVLDHYTGTYGPDSEQVKDCKNGYFYEPSVAEAIFLEMIAEQRGIKVFTRHELKEVTRTDREVTAIRIQKRGSNRSVLLHGKVFVDATYEGDLAAAAGVAYRLGREGRSEYNEAHAGVVYMDHSTRALLPGTTGLGDNRLPAYTYRLCFSSDPANSVYPDMPPDYDRSRYVNYFLDLKLGRLTSAVQAFSIARIPNQKYDVNMKPWPLGFPFAEENMGYPEASWAEREKIMERIRNITLGLMYFLQNDPEVPEADRAEARKYGLAKDEFTDNGNFPFQFYVREARRIVGEYTLTENDLTYAPESFRTPVHADAISAGEFPIDAFPTRKYEKGHEEALEGYILMLNRYTRPYQIPYRCILPKDVDGLIVPVAASTTHIAFSSVRLEPTWVSLGQAAGVAAHLAIQADVQPRSVSVARLQRMLLDQKQVITFFDDLPKSSPYFASFQYLGAKGFFNDYKARPDEPLTKRDATQWARKTLEAAGAPAHAFLVSGDDVPIRRDTFESIVNAVAQSTGASASVASSAQTVTRAEACERFDKLLRSINR